jgi:hypothetical protein
MKTVLQRDNLGIVLSMQSSWDDAGQSPMTGHLILNRLRVDDDGNICLSSPDGFQGILDQVEELKFELDQLANETVLWLANNIAVRRPRLSLVANSN